MKKLAACFVTFLEISSYAQECPVNQKCNPVVVTPSVGERFNSHSFNLILDATIPYGSFSHVIISAISATGKFDDIILGKNGWIPVGDCGTSSNNIIANCARSPGEKIRLTDGIKNETFADLDILVKYHIIKDKQILETGYSFQCTRFAGYPFCLVL